MVRVPWILWNKNLYSSYLKRLLGEFRPAYFADRPQRPAAFLQEDLTTPEDASHSPLRLSLSERPRDHFKQLYLAFLALLIHILFICNSRKYGWNFSFWGSKEDTAEGIRRDGRRDSSWAAKSVPLWAHVVPLLRVFKSVWESERFSFAASRL